MDKQILQTGLYCDDDKETEQFAKRVDKFNTISIGNPVKLDIIPFEKGDSENGIPQPHYKLRLLFPSREVQRRFWTE